MDSETLTFLVFVVLIAVAGITVGLFLLWSFQQTARMDTYPQPFISWVAGRLLG